VATEKQRRRRAKEKRHDYDLVYVDEEGNEVPVESEPKPRKPPAKVAGGKGGSKQQRSSGRAGRKPPQPPSWSRVAKRGMIFAPIFLLTVLLLGGKSTGYLGAALQALLLIVVFIPFSYFMDRVVWRQYQKRIGKTG
jgi:hypothetical protein